MSLDRAVRRKPGRPPFSRIFWRDAGHRPDRGLLRWIGRRWRSSSIDSRFTLAAMIIVLASMATLGTVVNLQTRASKIQGMAESSAYYMAIAVSPLIQDIGEGVVPPDVERNLDRLLLSNPLHELNASVIWQRDGTVAYSTEKSMMGRIMPSPELALAFSGQTVANLENLSEHGDERQDMAGTALLEIYLPLYDMRTGDVIAVGEFYEVADRLQAQLTNSAYAVWGTIITTTLVMVVLLYFTIHRTSLVVRSQRTRLGRSLTNAKSLAGQNAVLRREAEQARLDAIKANQDLLARLGADLHDGAIQLLTLLVLQLQSGTTGRRRQQDTRSVELATDVLRELRNLSNGLVLPEIDSLSVEDALRLAISRHEALTGTKVKSSFGPLPDQVEANVKICLYRIVQECLNNAFRHAAGMGQSVSARLDEDHVVIDVRDAGAGVPTERRIDGARGLGIYGLTTRLKTLGGTLKIEAASGEGTQVTARIPVRQRIESVPVLR